MRVFRIKCGSAEFGGWKQPPHPLQAERSFASLDSIQQCEEGRRCQKCQLASQIKQNIWRLHRRPKPKNEFDLKEIVRPIFRFHLFTCNHSAVLWRKIFPADANTVQTYGDHVLKHLSFSTWSRRHRFFSLEEETSLTRFSPNIHCCLPKQTNIHVSISEFGKTVYMQLEPDIFVVE